MILINVLSSVPSPYRKTTTFSEKAKSNDISTTKKMVDEQQPKRWLMNNNQKDGWWTTTKKMLDEQQSVCGSMFSNKTHPRPEISLYRFCNGQATLKIKPSWWKRSANMTSWAACQNTAVVTYICYILFTVGFWRKNWIHLRIILESNKLKFNIFMPWEAISHDPNATLQPQLHTITMPININISGTDQWMHFRNLDCAGLNSCMTLWSKKNNLRLQFGQMVECSFTN